MTYKFKPHTVLMMIGPTGCGKSSLSENIAVSFKRKYGTSLKGHLLSSDQNRAMLLNQGWELNKRDPRMQQVSKQAFELLFTELKSLMSYPVSSELIVIDTTGMAKEFRDQVATMVKEYHYNLDAVVFDYKDQKEFYRYLDENENTKKIVAQAVKRFRTKTLPEVRSKDFNQLIRLKDRVDSITIEMEQYEFYKDHFLDPEKSYVAIGDVHGCANELKAVVENIKEDDIPILIGDFIDKGPQVKETIEFVFDKVLTGKMKVVLGNHENFVWKVLTNKVDKTKVNPMILETYFDSLPLLESDEELKRKFIDICEMSYGFLIHPHYILTHAPCDQKYLGKIDPVSLREQRNMRRRDDISTLEQIQFLYDQAEFNFPYHVFGHVAFEETFRFKNKIGIDTGCVEGNKLTCVHLFDKPFIKDVKSGLEKTKDLVVIPKREVEFNFNDLTPRDRKRIWSCANNKINFISGTVSPADKLGVELESLKAGLDYYKDQGFSMIMMQTKYMGSRCQIYLNMFDVTNSYAVSRNGYKIRGELTDVYMKLFYKFEPIVPDNVKMIILDGEIMPWGFLGEGLIAKHFYPVEHALNHEIQLLIESNFHKMFQDLKQKKDQSDFAKDSTSMKKSDLSNKYKGQYESFKCVDDFDFINFDQEVMMIQTYNEQMKLYASEGEVHYKPFNILKFIHEDGLEAIPDNNFNSYEMISEDPICYVDLTADDYYEQAVKHWNTLVKDNTIEGVVIKPQISLGDYAPYIKVRNSNYLHIVYGHDYTHETKYQKLLKRKSIKRKMRTSIKEFALGMEMLKVPYSEISPDNKEYKTLVAKMIGLEATEKELDPRL